MAMSDPTGARQVRNSRRALLSVIIAGCTGRPDNSGTKRLQQSPPGVRNSRRALFSMIFAVLYGSIPITLEPNDYHSHLQGSVRSQEPLTLPKNSIGRHRGDVRTDWCQIGPKFQTYSVFGDLCSAVRVGPTTLGPNDHHSHLRGPIRSQEPLTLPQNSIGNFRGDIRPDLCQSGLFTVPA
ncbi:hypothetical protein CRG98_036781 [Punica granatum]|uniref:Uncharacterized protein n=1 Tax=Punica granatum TaxID=22663 RepID=A0A2I0IGK7_PUNGR|nr:hypothetical protein CRG98_036781 [Punica granatum]